MKVIVSLAPCHRDDVPERTEEFDNAAGWHIDEERQLHVKKSGHAAGNLAAYGVNAWLSVREDASS